MLVSNTDEVELSSHKKNLNASFDWQERTISSLVLESSIIPWIVPFS